MKHKKQDVEFIQDQDLENNSDLNQISEFEEQDKALDDVLAQFDQQHKKSKKKKEFYVKKQDLLDEIALYQQSKKTSKDGQGQISQRLGQMVLKICTRFSLHPKFFGYSYRQEMVADAVMRCLSKGLDKIDTKNPNSNPFAYLTQIAFNCFRARINNEKKFMTVKQRFRQEHYGDFERIEGLRQTEQNDLNDEQY